MSLKRHSSSKFNTTIFMSCRKWKGVLYKPQQKKWRNYHYNTDSGMSTCTQKCCTLEQLIKVHIWPSSHVHACACVTYGDELFEDVPVGCCAWSLNWDFSALLIHMEFSNWPQCDSYKYTVNQLRVQYQILAGVACLLLSTQRRRLWCTARPVSALIYCCFA